MESYRAIYFEHGIEREIELDCATVTDISLEKRGTLARMVTPTGKERKFWISRPDSLGGARCHVVAQDAKRLPIVLNTKKDYKVELGTIVLFKRPKKTSAVFPVILLEDYEIAVTTVRQHRALQKRTASSVPFGKGRHRFVD